MNGKTRGEDRSRSNRAWTGAGLLLALACTPCAQADPVIAEVYRGPSSRPGYQEVVQLLDANKQIIWSIDLRAGESFVEAGPDHALFRHSDGRLYRLDAPFTGGFQQVAEAPPRKAADDAAALGLLLGLISVFGQGLAGDQDDAPAPRQDPTPTPPPAYEPRPTPTPKKMIYTVVVSGDQLRCLDAETSGIQGSFSPAGRIVSGPVVTGDMCTVVIEGPTGRQARTFRLPSFSQVSSTYVQPSE